MKSPFLQTLPVGSVVLSVLAEDKDTGTAGVVQYFIQKVSVKSSCGPSGSRTHCVLRPPGGSIFTDNHNPSSPAFL